MVQPKAMQQGSYRKNKPNNKNPLREWFLLRRICQKLAKDYHANNNEYLIGN
jgi:hypothetical protein